MHPFPNLAPLRVLSVTVVEVGCVKVMGFASVGFASMGLFTMALTFNRPTLAQAAQPTLLQQLHQCIQQQNLAQFGTDNPPTPTSPEDEARSQALAQRCFFSVVMLNPDGSVRQDSGARMALLLEQTGARMTRPKGQGQAQVALQIQSARSLYKVPVTIQSQRFSFLLDTGASNTVIDHQTARRLKLQGKPIPANLLGYLAIGKQPNRQNPMIYTLPPIELGQARVTQLTGIGLSTRVAPFSCDGILGLDFLSQFDLVISPKSRSMMLLRPSLPVANGIPLQGKLGVMTLSSVFVNGKGPYTFLLDTGAAVTTLSDGLGQQLGLKLNGVNAVDVIGLSGQVAAQWSRLNSLTLDRNHRLTNQAVLVANSQVFQTLGVNGVIGQDILSQYRQRWRFGPPGPLGTPERGSLELSVR
jgi:predicted aspartyl protease